MKKQFKPLAEFIGRDVDLYRSINPSQTAVYHNCKGKEAYFEVLVFGFDMGKKELYIRYPETDYFVEMEDGRSGSSHGVLEHKTAKDEWQKYVKEVEYFKDDKNFLLHIGTTHNFLQHVAHYDKGNPYEHNYPNETKENYQEIESALQLMYLKLPDELYSIGYVHKTQDEEPTYIYIDSPKYNFGYENHRLFVIKNGNAVQYKITKMRRYRDGGTTIIECTDAVTNHTFYSPTSFNKELKTKWDEQEIIDVTPEEKESIIKLLGVMVQIPETELS